MVTITAQFGKCWRIHGKGKTMNRYVMVDPPQGWRYGFPKLFDTWSGEKMYDWIVTQGYPKSVRDKYGRYFLLRYWNAEPKSN